MSFRLEVDFDYDFDVAGISCHERGYRLCWMLNRYLGFNFKRDEDLELKMTTGSYYFPAYSSQTQEDDEHFILIKNRIEGALLVPELRHVDFLLKMDQSCTDYDSIISQLRKIKIIQAVFEIQVEQLNSKDNLIFE